MLSNLQKQFQRIGRLFSYVALLIGVIGLCGWILDYEPFKTFHMGSAIMKSNSALLLIISSSLFIFNRANDKRNVWSEIGAFIVLTFGLLTLAEHIFQINLRIDEIFFVVKNNTNSISIPGRITWMGATCFVLISLSFLLHYYEKVAASQVLSLLVVVLTYVIILAYYFKINTYYDYGLYSSISFPTSLALFLLGFASLLRSPEKEIMSVFSSNRASGMMVRYLYIYSIVSIPLQVAFYLYLIHHLSFTAEESIVFILIASSITSFPIAMMLINKIRRLDKERFFLTKELKETNLNLIDANSNLQAMVEEFTLSNESLVYTTEKLNIANKELITSNQRFEKLHNELAQMVADRTADLEYTLIELRERNQELDQYVYKVSHDIRSPVASIAGVINLIKLEQPPLNIQHYLDMVENRIGKLDDFIQSVLTHSKCLNSPIIAEPINFKQLLNQCWEELKYDKNWNKIKLKIDIEPGLVFKSDPIRLEIIFKNLMSNSIRYQKPSGDSWISISVHSDSENTIIKVIDNGVGIEEEHMSKIFQMFYRASYNSEGSGLGLYIVNQVVERMKGDVSIKSLAQQGTAFTILFPKEDSKDFTEL